MLSVLNEWIVSGYEKQWQYNKNKNPRLASIHYTNLKKKLQTFELYKVTKEKQTDVNLCSSDEYNDDMDIDYDEKSGNNMDIDLLSDNDNDIDML